MADSLVFRWPDVGGRTRPTAGHEPRPPAEPLPFDLAAVAQDVHRFVSRRVRNVDDAADIAQQALLLACVKRSSRRGPNAFAWLLAIARNLIVDHYRARGRFRFLDASSLAPAEPALRTAPDAVHVTCLQRERLSCWVDCISRKLSLEEQVAVLLADVYGHRDKDSAAELGLSLPSFKLLLHRARARLNTVAGGSCGLVCNARAAGAERCRGRTSEAALHRGSRSPELLTLRGRLLRGLDL
jgi:DNA-directed RNA polymerase specialized sigma24 family protein